MVRWPLAALLLWSPAPQPLETPDRLLEAQLELAREDRVYVLLERDRVRAFLRGLEVQTLPLESHDILGTSPSSSARLDLLIPKLPEKVVVGCAGCDDFTGTTSLEDRIGLQDMPANFLAILGDGTCWLVLSESGWSPSALWTSSYWRSRLLIHYLRSVISGGQGQLLVTRMQSEDARALYWTLQPGIGVLRGEGGRDWLLASAVVAVFLAVLGLVCVWAAHRRTRPAEPRNLGRSF